ncbi:MAG TPA: PilZ domain-containing protein [Bryobacteraceae bacterium]|nr:PilZ domain-containing protein [Bryobacteraceae bacterium]
MDFCRKELRWACDPRIVLAHLDGFDEPIAGEVVEVSRTGVQLHLANPIPIGTLVMIEVGTLVVLGDVRHCDASPNDYYTVGLQTCDVQRG